MKRGLGLVQRHFPMSSLLVSGPEKMSGVTPSCYSWNHSSLHTWKDLCIYLNEVEKYINYWADLGGVGEITNLHASSAEPSARHAPAWPTCGSAAAKSNPTTRSRKIRTPALMMKFIDFITVLLYPWLHQMNWILKIKDHKIHNSLIFKGITAAIVEA